jgi:hypothetical protein
MAVYTVTHGIHLDGVSAVQTLTSVDNVRLGDSVTVAGAGAKFNATAAIISVEPYAYTGKDDDGYLQFDYDDPRPNQVLYEVANQTDDDGYYELDGTLTYTATVTWVVDADVTAWLGISSATANDTAFITTCTAAANAWCYRKRKEAGYTDATNTSPSADVKLGTIMYAGTLYRERGSVDSFASFDGMGSLPIPATLGRIMQLLGCGRAQVA